MIHDFVPLAPLDDIVFGGWDTSRTTCTPRLATAGVLEAGCLKIRVRARNDQSDARRLRSAYVKRLSGPQCQKGHEQWTSPTRPKRHPQLQEEAQLRARGDGVVRLHRIYLQEGPEHPVARSSFEKGLRRDEHETIRAVDGLRDAAMKSKVCRSPTARRTSPPTFRRRLERRPRRTASRSAAKT